MAGSNPEAEESRATLLPSAGFGAARPRVSVVIPTRNRGSGPADAVATVLASAHDSFEVVVVDQSENDDSESALAPFRADPRFRYVRSATRGASRARNVGIAAAKADLMLFTDDDCTVPADWITTMQDLVGRNSQIGAVYCTVTAAPSEREGYTPVFEPEREVTMRRVADKTKGNGMSAALAVRRSAMDDLAGFDEQMGPGSPFYTGEDTDLTVRLLLHGWQVVISPRVAVVHHGFRDLDQTRRLLRGDWISIGACYGKYLRARRWATTRVLAYELVSSLRRPLSELLHARRPRGLRQPGYLMVGFVRALRMPVDPLSLQFSPQP